MCWGRNGQGQLGLGYADEDIHGPAVVVGLGDETAYGPVQSGLHACVVTMAGGAKCWGWNIVGQVGDGTFVDQPAPVDVIGLTSGAAAISVGAVHTCAVTVAGGVRCWARDYGQPGDIDRDGCSDPAEQGTVASVGGLRNSIDRWDFFDVPTGATLMRDKSVTVSDITQEVLRFGTMGDLTADPLSTPEVTGYHPAYDRGGPAGVYIWNQAPANGSITVADIAAMVGQFGHTCS
jgi:hypothetical protein